MKHTIKPQCKNAPKKMKLFPKINEKTPQKLKKTIILGYFFIMKKFPNPLVIFGGIFSFFFLGNFFIREYIPNAVRFACVECYCLFGGLEL